MPGQSARSIQQPLCSEASFAFKKTTLRKGSFSLAEARANPFLPYPKPSVDYGSQGRFQIAYPNSCLKTIRLRFSILHDKLGKPK